MNIDWIKVCSIGLKVVLAVGTGLAVLAGVNHAIKNGEATNGNIPSNNGGNQFVAPEQQQPVDVKENTVAGSNKVNHAAVVSNGLRATQSSLEKLIAIVGSITVAAESISTLFSNNNSAPYYNPSWYGGGCSNGGGSYWQPAPQGGQFYGNRQINPFIQEVGRVPGFNSAG